MAPEGLLEKRVVVDRDAIFHLIIPCRDGILVTVMRQEKSGRKADVWSLGCTVIEMFIGHRPWLHFTHPLTLLYHIATTSAPPEYPEMSTGIAR
jgi:serine/threonine protein kinase